MLTPSIAKGYSQNVEQRARTKGVATVRSAATSDAAKTQVTPILFKTATDTWLNNEDLAAEIFGPSAVLVRAKSKEELLRIASAWHGTLTASLFGTPQDLEDNRDLIAILEQKAGRLIFNGFPTGVEVTYAMHHGGPYPATGDAKFTSVGTAAILRFLRPVCFQNFPQEALPAELENANPRKIWRMVNGALTREGIAG
jgi:2,5-dioxopentanoate dehydrogenase